MRTWMREARETANLTMAKTAEQLGISESYYSMIEAGQRQQRLDIAIAVKLSTIFGLPLETIIANEEVKQ